MPTDKTVTTATIRFYANKHVEVEIDGLKNVHPRALDIGHNMLVRKYLEKRSQFNAQEHRAAEKAQKEAEAAAIKDDAEFHAKEDERLALAAEEKLERVKAGSNDVPAPEESGVDSEPVTEAEPAANDSDEDTDNVA